MTESQRRLIYLTEEADALEAKKDALNTFIYTPVFSTLHPDERDDMYDQYYAMCNYSDALSRRITRLAWRIEIETATN